MEQITSIAVGYWGVIIAIIALLASAGWAGYTFLGLPTTSQVAKIKEWLLWAVAQAESELGSETGALKLRLVYDMFTDKFPVTAKIVSFETFAKWVDDALDILKDLLANSPAIAAVITGEEPTVE